MKEDIHERIQLPQMMNIIDWHAKRGGEELMSFATSCPSSNGYTFYETESPGQTGSREPLF